MVRAFDRRTFLHSVCAGTAAVFGGCVQGTWGDDDDTETTPSGEGLPEAIGLETVVDGLELPVDVAFAPVDDRWYVATQPGEILAFDSGGMRDEPLLDLTGSVVTGYEMGLLGIELHPAFEENRRLFVRYSSPPREGTPDGYDHTFVLAEFEVGEDGVRASPDSERTVMEIPQPQPNHNAGDVLFGPDGYLYVPTGDGGGAGDEGVGHADDWYDANDGGNGQDTEESLLGGILRIDVDAEPTEPPQTSGDGGDEADDGADGYAIPEDNPLVGEEGHRGEYYAWGVRNPWGTSFDGDDFFVADVGQDGAEEVNLVEMGGNYGWNVKEGTDCFAVEGCPDETPADVRGGEPLIDPIVEYPNEGPTEDEMNGSAVVGGHVYRGSAVAGLDGRYVFGDLQPNGRLFVGTPEGDGESWRADVVHLADDAAGALDQLLSFGRDDEGELYALGSGGIHRIVAEESL